MILINKKGFIHKKKIIEKKSIKKIKQDMLSVMGNFVSVPNDYDIDKKLDKTFNKITKKSITLRSNIFKALCQIYSIPQLLYQKKLLAVLKRIGFKDPIINNFGILAVEPYEERFLFNIHQDLRTVFASYHAINIWIPITGGNDIGGMGLYEGSYKLGPVKHSVSKINAHEEVDLKYTKKFKKVEFNKLEEGDCFIFTPFNLHYSIPNKGKKIRWTIRIVVDDVSKAKHFNKKFEPYDRAKFCDNRSNEERLNQILGKFKKKKKN